MSKDPDPDGTERLTTGNTGRFPAKGVDHIQGNLADCLDVFPKDYVASVEELASATIPLSFVELLGAKLSAVFRCARIPNCTRTQFRPSFVYGLTL